MTIRAICENCGEHIEIKRLYTDFYWLPKSEYSSLDLQWRHTKTLYAWCHVTKAKPKISIDEPVCSNLL